MNKGMMCVVLLVSSFITSAAFADAAMYTPEQAISDALSSPLEFVGLFIPAYSVSQKYAACLYRNEKVLVLSQYCVASTVPAVSVRIHSRDASQGAIDIYAEVESTTPQVDASQFTRASYLPDLWAVANMKVGAGFDFMATLADYQKFDDAETNAPFEGCVTGGSLTMDTKNSACSSAYAGSLAAWTPAGFGFFTQPSANWYELVKQLKAKAIAENPGH